jgi:Papain family cysteine protease
MAVAAAHDWMAGGMLMSAEDAMWAGHQICSVPGTDETSIEWVLQGLALHGHATEAAWPYGTPTFRAGRPPAAQDAGARLGLPAWRQLTDCALTTLAAELARPAAVVVGFQVVYTAWREPAGGRVDAQPGRKVVGNHAVLVVGTVAEPDGIIIKNSWGTGWADAGFAVVTERYLDHYGLLAYALEAPTA